MVIQLIQLHLQGEDEKISGGKQKAERRKMMKEEEEEEEEEEEKMMIFMIIIITTSIMANARSSVTHHLIYPTFNLFTL